MPRHFLFINKQAVLSSAQTNQSQFSFPASFRPEIEHVVSGADFRHQKNLAPEKYDRLTTGAWNWPVCHHYKTSFGMFELNNNLQTCFQKFNKNNLINISVQYTNKNDLKYLHTDINVLLIKQ